MSKKPTTGQLRAKAAVYLRAEGHSLGAIAAVLDVSKTHVVRMTTPPAINYDQFVDKVARVLCTIDLSQFAVKGPLLSGGKKKSWAEYKAAGQAAGDIE